jgi:hypothetical protein
MEPTAYIHSCVNAIHVGFIKSLLYSFGNKKSKGIDNFSLPWDIIEYILKKLFWYSQNLSQTILCLGIRRTQNMWL